MNKSLYLLLPAFLFASSNSLGFNNGLFNIKVEAGAGFNDGITTNNFTTDIDLDGLSATFTENVQNISFYGGLGFSSNILVRQRIMLELLYGYISNPDLKLEQKFTQDNGTTEADFTEKFRLQRHSLLLNAYFKPVRFKINNNASIKPFLNLGVGAGYSSTGDTKFKERTTATDLIELKGNSEFNFAWAVGGGVSINNFDIGYRYVNAGTHVTEKKYDILTTTPVTQGNLNKALEIDLVSHLVYAGITF